MLFKFQNTCKSWLISRQVVKQAPKSKAALKALFKQKSVKSYAQYYTVVIPGGLYPTALSTPNLKERAGGHPALARVWSTAKEKWEGILTTHLLATNLAVKCNQLVSPGSLCSRGRESKAPAEGHSVHPN